METQHLEEFVDLARTLSFTETARNLHLAQPTLSKHITQLEQEFDATLLDRSHANVHLTEEGLCLLAAATDALDSLRFARKNIADIKAHRPIKVSGRFDDAAVLGIITTASAKAGEEFPAVALEHRLAADPLKMLADGDTDIMIDLMPGDFDEGLFAARRLFTRPAVAVVGRDHPLCSREHLAFGDLRGCTFLRMLRPNEGYAWDSILRICHENGFEPKTRTVTVNGYSEGLVHPLGDCVLVYPSATKELRYLAMTDRVILPFDDETAHFTVYAICRSEDAERFAPFLDRMDEAVTAFELAR